MTRTAIGYIRVSTGKQAEHGISLEAQRAKIEAYCTLHDLDLLEVLEDASSAKSIDGRTAMKQLLKLARSGGVHAVVTIKLDRMFRNTVEAITVIPELQALGVATHIMDLGGAALDTSTPMGGFFLTVAAAFAEMERKQIAERTRTALRHKRDAGKQYSATAPYGWQYVEGELCEHPTEQLVVRTIFSLAYTDLGPTAIADRLIHRDGHKPRNARLWSPSTISKILKHPLNIEKYSNSAHVSHCSETHGQPATSEGEESRGDHVRQAGVESGHEGDSNVHLN